MGAVSHAAAVVADAPVEHDPGGLQEGHGEVVLRPRVPDEDLRGPGLDLAFDLLIDLAGRPALTIDGVQDDLRKRFTAKGAKPIPYPLPTRKEDAKKNRVQERGDRPSPSPRPVDKALETPSPFPTFRQLSLSVSPKFGRGRG
jgi:hypothetical protein